jgi:hypothetical protein
MRTASSVSSQAFPLPNRLCVYITMASITNPKRGLPTSARTRVINSGLWHFTTPEALRSIAHDGIILPNRGHLRSQHGISPLSCCYRLGGVSLFDPRERPERSWLRIWMRVHKPLTVGIRLARKRLIHNLLAFKEMRRRCQGGVILPGEVCYEGEIPMKWCTGYLLVLANGPFAGEFVEAPASLAKLEAAARKLKHRVTKP